MPSIRARLATDFVETDAATVSSCFERAVSELLRAARITEFVPVLADRYARVCIVAS